MLKLLKNPLFIIIVTVITVIFYISLSKTAQKTLSTAQKIDVSQDDISTLEKEKTSLEEKLQDINSEKMIRNEFLMQKEGEYVVKVPSLPEESKIDEDNEKESNLDKWWKLLF